MSAGPQKSHGIKNNLSLKRCGFPQDFLKFKFSEKSMIDFELRKFGDFVGTSIRPIRIAIPKSQSARQTWSRQLRPTPPCTGVLRS
jgi:hypothetical protein